MSRKQKTVLTVFIVVVCLLIMAGGGYLFILNKFPLNYEEHILSSSKKYGLDPSYTCAIIWTESKFKPKDVSNKGAVGLMQIMPDTGEWIAGKLKLEDYTEEMLYEPNLNIEMGCWYLNFLSERFDADKDKMAAAYNAGHGRAKEWFEDTEKLTGEELAELIPYKETRDYVERVNQAYEFYKLLYNLS